MKKTFLLVLALIIGLFVVPDSFTEDSQTPVDGIEITEDFINNILARKTNNAEPYSTLDAETLSSGNRGVISYVREKSGGIVYLILDFDEGCMYRNDYSNEETVCERAAIISGELTKLLNVQFYDGHEEWGNVLYWTLFWEDPVPPDYLTLLDQNGNEYTFTPMDLGDTLHLLKGKTIRDYSNGKPFYKADNLSGTLGDTPQEIASPTSEPEEVKKITFESITFEEAYSIKHSQGKTGHSNTYLLFDTKTNTVYRYKETRARGKTSGELLRGTFVVNDGIRECTYEDGSTGKYEKLNTSIKHPGSDTLYKSVDVANIVNSMKRYLYER